MLQIAILGLGSFGVRMLEELSAVGCEIIVVDRDAEKIEKYKTHARAVYITDVINKDSFMKIIPSNIDAAIVDFDHLLEPAILTTHYLHQMGIKNIVVQCENDTHGELLTLAGASQIVYPEVINILSVDKDENIESKMPTKLAAEAGDSKVIEYKVSLTAQSVAEDVSYPCTFTCVPEYFTDNTFTTVANAPYITGEIIGKDMLKHGISINLAPCLEINENLSNPLVNVRGYGKTKERRNTDEQYL